MKCNLKQKILKLRKSQIEYTFDQRESNSNPSTRNMSLQNSHCINAPRMEAKYTSEVAQHYINIQQNASKQQLSQQLSF